MAKVASEVRDPVCGKPVDPLRARAVGIFGGVTYYFCSAECKAKYKDPRNPPRPAGAPVIPASIRAQAAEEAKRAETVAKTGAPPPAAPPPAATEKPAAPPPAASPDRTLDAWVASAPKTEELRVEASAELDLRDRDHAGDAAADVPAPPSPSVVAELKAARPSPKRTWVIVSLLFAVAAAVLFFSLRSR
jgi:YHS domain-containing protein